MSKAIKWSLILLPVILSSCQSYTCYSKEGKPMAVINMQNGNDSISSEGIDKVCKSMREHLNDQSN